MTTNNPVGYCPRCQQNVLLKREDIDTCLAIVLLLFTAGIGLIVYLIIYYSKPENRCVHCGTEVTQLLDYPYSPTSEQITYEEQIENNENPFRASSQKTENKTNTQSKMERGSPLSYCPFCGNKLETRKEKFCPSCGTKIN